MNPVLIVELDDSSHQRDDRRKRDALVDSAFHAANLPILHVPWQKNYSPEDLKQQIHDKLNPKDELAAAAALDMPPPLQDPAAAVAEPNDSPPMCAKCDVEMVERKASRGKHKGKRVWACPSYPECKTLIPID